MSVTLFWEFMSLTTIPRNKNGHPIYTLRFPGCRLYVVNASSLIPIIERQTHTLSFAPIESAATAAVLKTSNITNEIMARDPGNASNHFAVFSKTVRPVLARGPSLDAMFRRSFHTMSLSLDKQLTLRCPMKVSLFSWTSHEITLAGTNAEYGKADPFQEPHIEQAWQSFVEGLPILVGGVFPDILARKSVEGRECLVQAFLRYFQDDHHLTDGSGAVLARLKHNTTSGMPLADTARGEIGACMALLNNTIPGVFWLIYHIYSDPVVLRDLRHELMADAGVPVSHEAISAGIDSIIEAESVEPGWRLLQFSNFFFDVSVSDIFRMLSVGATLCMAPIEVMLSDLTRVINDIGVTQLFITPTATKLLRPDEVPDVEGIYLAGKLVPEDLAET